MKEAEPGWFCLFKPFEGKSVQRLAETKDNACRQDIELMRMIGADFAVKLVIKASSL